MDGEGPDRPETWASLRPLLFSIAYRMLGSVADAEDVVQEAFIRLQRAEADGAEIGSLRAYLSTVVTRLSIDELRSARSRRESYVGEWMPEPLITDDGDDPAAHAEQADTLSMAFLLVLERLNPVERAVFLLHDVFGYGYDEIAPVVGKGEANCRQLAARARRHVAQERPRFDAPRRERDELASRFFAAVVDGEVDRLVEMLAADVTVHGDGGGKAPQFASPVAGALRVARLLAGAGRVLRELGARLRRCEINGQPGAEVLGPDGMLVNVFVLDIADGTVQAVRSVVNPDKLQHIGPVADAHALLQQWRDGGRPRPD